MGSTVRRADRAATLPGHAMTPLDPLCRPAGLPHPAVGATPGRGGRRTPAGPPCRAGMHGHGGRPAIARSGAAPRRVVDGHASRLSGLGA
jgi:hypothetical protein